MRVSAKHVDRWLRWYHRKQRIEANDAALNADPTDAGLYKANEALKRQMARWKLPRGWRSWEELGHYVQLQSRS